MLNKRSKALFLGLFFILGLSACNRTINGPSSSLSSGLSNETNSGQQNLEEEEMTLMIDNKEINVTWEDNESLKALKKLAKPSLMINLHMYGGFEQVGSIGQTLPSNDTRITTNPGDIVLYSSDQIVLFYGSNTWSYTKLGHMNLEENELVELLGQKDVTITLTLN